MNTLKRGLFFAVILLAAHLSLAAADAPATPPANTSLPPTAVPAVGVWLLPAVAVFQSWADYRHSLRLESGELGGAEKFRGVKITSMDTVIRRADTGKPVARIPFQGAIGTELADERPRHTEFSADSQSHDARATALPADQAKALDQNPPGDYLVAIYVNGVRASNVVKITIDPAFDATKAPTLQLGGLEAHPRAPFGRVVLWAIAPIPADPQLTNFSLDFCPIQVDGMEYQPPFPGIGGLGPRPLTSGQRYATFLAYDPDYDATKPHTYAISFTPADHAQFQPRGRTDPSLIPRHYTAALFAFDPQARPLGQMWDWTSPPDESRHIPPPGSAAAHTPIPSVWAAAPALQSTTGGHASQSEPSKGLRFAKGPSDGPDDALDFAQYILAGPNPSDIHVDLHALSVEPPLDTYILDAQQVANGKGLEAVEHGDSLVYLIDSAGVTVATTDMLTKTGEVYSLSYRGGEVSGALKHLGALDQVRNGSYEARLLGTPIGFRDSSPASYQFIWLKSDAPGGDLIYTLSYTMPELQPEKLYTPAEFFKIIQPIAKNQLEENANNPPPADFIGGAKGGAK